MKGLPQKVSGDGPAVLLVHGWGGFKEGWGPLVDEIVAAAFRAVAIDLPGWGEAAAPPRFAHRPEDYAEALTEPIRRHAPVAIIGHSMGCAPAVLAARAHDLAGLVAIGPQWSPAGRGSLTSWRGISRLPLVGPTLMRAGLARARRDRSAIRDSFLSAMARPDAEITDPRLRGLLEEATDRFAATDTRTLARSVAPLLAFDVRPIAQEVRSDILLVLGARDRVIDNGGAGWAIAPARRVRSLTIAGVAHFPHFEAPEQAAPAIIDHLRTVAATSTTP